MEKSLTLRYNVGSVALLGAGVALTLLRLSDSQWIPAALMFVAGLPFGFLYGGDIWKHRDALLTAKWSEDVAEILHESWRSWRHLGFLIVGLIGAGFIAVRYGDSALKTGLASILALLAGREAGRLPSLVALGRYAREPGPRSLRPNTSFERTREG